MADAKCTSGSKVSFEISLRSILPGLELGHTDLPFYVWEISDLHSMEQIIHVEGKAQRAFSLIPICPVPSPWEWIHLSYFSPLSLNPPPPFAFSLSLFSLSLSVVNFLGLWFVYPPNILVLPWVTILWHKYKSSFFFLNDTMPAAITSDCIHIQKPSVFVWQTIFPLLNWGSVPMIFWEIEIYTGSSTIMFPMIKLQGAKWNALEAWPGWIPG